MNDIIKLDEYMNSNPKKSLRLLIFGLSLLWYSAAAFFGFGMYIFAAHLCNVKWWKIIGVIGLILCVYLQQFYPEGMLELIKAGFNDNLIFWKYLVSGMSGKAGYHLNHEGIGSLIGVSMAVMCVFTLSDLIPSSPHAITMDELQKGVHTDSKKELSDKQLTKKLSNLRDDYNGTILGVSKYSGSPILIPDHDVNQIALVLGTTGSGKTVTLRRFYQRAIKVGYPLIIVDGKPDEGNIAWLAKLAAENKRPFFGFNCDKYCHYDPLANGGFTELKDKIISLKDQWENDYYRSIAEDYLQTTFAVLLKAGKPFDLKRVVNCLNYDNLSLLGRETEDEVLIKRISVLANYERKDITGLQAHLNLLIHSELGEFFDIDESTFTLQEVIRQQGVVYFALPALRFPSFSKVLGKLVINDIKAVIDRNSSNAAPVFTVFDEFSVFAGEQVLNLVNMGRGKGVHAVFGTQGLGDLDKVDPMFKSQIMNCANTLICHRLNDVESAETVANWIGTKDVFTVTAQLDTKNTDAGLGTVRRNKEYIVHPDEIKQGLQTGEAFWVSKVRGFRWEKVGVKFS